MCTVDAGKGKVGILEGGVRNGTNQRSGLGRHVGTSDPCGRTAGTDQHTATAPRNRAIAECAPDLVLHLLAVTEKKPATIGAIIRLRQ